MKHGPDSQPLNILPVLTSGFIIGLMETAFAISLAALIFSGPLEEFRSIGIGLALLGMAISSTIIVLFTSLPGIVSGLQEIPAVILALIASEILLLMPPDASQGAILITVLAAISLSTLATALVFFALGTFRLGNLVRFLPYPVIGGFLAATGWLLLAGGLGLMVTLPANFSELGVLFDPLTLLRWLPGVVLAFLMLFAARRRGNVMVVPILLVGVTILFYLTAVIGGISLEQLQQGGWVLGPFPEGSLWRPFPFEDLGLIQWPALLQEAGHLAIVILVSVISLLLNAGGLELASNRDIDVNRELKIAGVGNVLSALVSGMIGFQKLGVSTMNFRLKADHRLTGLISVAIFVVALVFGAAILSFVPLIVLGSLLFYLGLDFLADWVVDTRKKLPLIDYAVLLSILFVTVFIGFLEAITLGLMLAIVFFVVGYSRIDIVRCELTGRTFKSRLVRPRRQREQIKELGDRLFILQLQGFIFFGTANQLLERVRQRMHDPDRLTPSAVILDFHRVSGIDSTAIMSFSRMKQLTAEYGAALVFVSASEAFTRLLQHGDLSPDQEGLRYFSDLDRAVQWGEDRLLAQSEPTADSSPPGITMQLKEILGTDSDLADVLPYFERMETELGQTLIHMGSEARDLFFIESGLVTAQIPRDSGPSIRLESIGAGHVVGEIGLYLSQERTADVVVDQSGVVYRLSDEALERLEKEDAPTAAALHRLMVLLLAERLTHLTESLHALEG